MFETILVNIEPGVRILVAGAFVLSLIVAGTHWAVRQQRINAFGAWARFVRRWSDPLLRPVEQRVVRAGGNPQDAPLWLVGVTVIGGLILLALVSWLLNFIYSIYVTAQDGQLMALLVRMAFELLKFALFARAIASWFNPSPYSLAMRTIHALTDWLIDPIRRVVPAIGMIDMSVLVAYLVLSFGESLVMRGLF